MAYVKNCNPGKITMDLPRSSYIYELPLLSFGDIHGNMNLSLIFNYQMKYESQNPFFIKEGYKLNIHKKLIFENGIPTYLMESNGSLVSIYGEDWPYSFHDGSQRFIRQTGNTLKPYVIENADYSKEYYDANGMIVSVVDKYNVTILSYIYEPRTSRLVTLNYRNGKIIQLAYSNSKLYTIAYSGSGCTTKFLYTTAGISVEHYAGEVFQLESNGINFRATATTANYATQLTKASDFSLVVSDRIANQTVNSTKYDFYNTVVGCSSNNYVDITNNEGVKIRNQYWRNQLAYSYEVTDSDIQFIGNRFAGSVQINKTMDNPYSSGALGTQNRWDGVQMTFNGSVSPNEWYFDVNAYATSGVAGYYVLTGWTKLLNNGDASICIAGLTNGYQYSYDPGSDLDGKWKFFAYRFYADAAYIRAYLPSSSVLETKDFRLTFQATHVINANDASKIAIMEYGLIPASNTSTFIPLHECEFIYKYVTEQGGLEEENISLHSMITFQDLLKHKINKAKSMHSGEVYINGCDEAFVLGSSGSFTARHKDPATQVITEYAVDNCHLGVRQYLANKMVTTRIRDDMDSFLAYQIVNASGTVFDYKYFNEYMDVIEEKVDGVTTTYTRNNDLVTATAVTDGSNSYTRTTTYGTNSDGNPTITTKDEFNKSTLYTLDSIWGVVKSVRLPDGSVITDTYDDDMCAMTKRTFGSTSGRSNTLAYSNGNISTLETGSLSYDFTYTKGKLTAVSKNDTRVKEHVHTGNTKTNSYYPSQSSALHSAEAKFDEYGRLTDITGVLNNVYDIAPTFSSSTGAMTPIGNNGSAFLAKTTDAIRGEVARFTYDQYNRVLSKKEVTSSSDYATKVSVETFAYDDIHRLTEQNCTYDQPNNKRVKSTVVYNKDADQDGADERVKTYTYAVNGSTKAVTENSFDVFGRVTQKKHTVGGKLHTRQFTYSATRVTQVSDSYGGNSHYFYNALGRLSRVAVHNKSVDYHYDSYGQLVREDNQALDATFVYAYNEIGNLTSIQKYTYTSYYNTPSGTPVTTSFGYTNDQLTSFGGATIPYNSIGCPTTYDGKTATWTRGKLTKLSSGTVSTSISNYTYTYNAYGQRVGSAYSYLRGKNSNPQFGQLLTSNKTYYYDHAGRLIAETAEKTYHQADATSERIVFLYDESGIIGMVRTVNGAANTYYFQRNLLGDVVAIFDTSGNMVAKYIYDAFGNCTVSSATTDYGVAYANPIRYRGYYYDDDTGLYYCNARYYSPKWRRFISPDDTAYLDPESVNGLNLYCYCGNDPVNYADPSGHIIISLLVGMAVSFAVGFACSTIFQYIQYGNVNWWQAGVDGLFAAASAALAYTGISWIGSVIAGAGMGMAQYTVDSAAFRDDFSWTGFLTAGFWGGLGGLASGRGAQHYKAIGGNLDETGRTGVKAILTAYDRYGTGTGYQKVMNLWGGRVADSLSKSISQNFSKSVPIIWGATGITYVACYYTGIGLNKLGCVF